LLKAVRKEIRILFQIFVHPTFLYLSFLGTAILILAVTSVYFLEYGRNPKINTFLDSLWWGVSTITTVGYGDVTPVTTVGRLIGLGLMYTGTVLFISFTGILVTLWTKKEVEMEIKPIEKEIALVEKELIPIEEGIAEEEKEQVRIEQKLDEILRRLDRLEK